MNTYRSLLIHGTFLAGFAALLTLPLVASAQEFVPLTSIPIFGDLGEGDNLAGFLNAVYRISIGAAAVLAVIQITRAGVMWMFGGTSIVETREARNLIVMSVFGLLLVLSPTIVFGIIDPRILSLDVNTAGLQTGNLGPTGTTFNSPTSGQGPGGPGGPAVAPNGQIESMSIGINDCRADLSAGSWGGLEGIAVPTGGVALDYMGKGNAEVGRICCTRYGGTVQSNPAPERCMLQSLINDDRYELRVLADARFKKQQTQGGIQEMVEVEERVTVKTPGAGSAAGGNQIAQYGFRTLAACNAAAASASSLDSHIRSHQGVVDGYVRVNRVSGGQEIAAGDLIQITGNLAGNATLGGAKCGKVNYVAKN